MTQTFLTDRPTPLPDTVAGLLAEKRKIRDRLDELNSEKSWLGQNEDQIDAAILKKMDAAGMTGDGAKLSNDGMTVTRKTKWRARYDPERWAEIFQWCAANGYDHLIHRRLSDAKVMELVDNSIALPEGLNVESFTDLEFRRS